MLARLQQFITLALIGASLGWALAALARGEGWVALAGAVLILAGYALVLGVEFGWMYHANQHDSLPGPRPSAALGAWWGEVRSAPRVFCWQQPFRAMVYADRWHGPPGQRGVVLIHGFVCNRGLWNSWLKRFALADIPCAAITLEPVFGDIDEYVPVIERSVRDMTLQTGRPPVLVAHSMGGLAVRAWMRARGHASALQDVHQVVTLGTPHAGTALARFAVTPNARQMRRDSEWLRQLAEAEPRDWHGRLTCLYSRCDNIVFPTSTAVLPGAASLEIPDTAHVHMVEHPLAFDMVMRLLTPGTAMAASDDAARPPQQR